MAGQGYGAIAITTDAQDEESPKDDSNVLNKVKRHARWWMVGGIAAVTFFIYSFSTKMSAGSRQRFHPDKNPKVHKTEGLPSVPVAVAGTSDDDFAGGDDDSYDSVIPAIAADDDIKDPNAVELFYEDQSVDHFDADNTDTWPHRYYTSQKFWGGPGNPIFVIMGGEGAVQNILYPFVSEVLAKEHSGFVLQTEHRFYGESQPTNKPKGKATNSELRKLLSPEQAMADFLQLIRHIQDELECSTHRSSPNYCPIVTVGASYPGFLAAMMRFVYPDVVDIAYASSAPLPLYSQELDPYAYFEKVTDVAEESSPGCAKAVKGTLLEIEVALHDPSWNFEEVAEQMGICVRSLPAYIDNLDTFRDVVTMVAATSFADFNMAYYPPTEDQDLVKACKIFQNDDDSAREKMNKFYKLKHDDASNCYDLRYELPNGKNATISSSDWSGVGDGVTGKMWDFQTCTELVVRAGFSDKSMFIPRKWTLQWLTDHCQNRFGATPQPFRLMDKWGFEDLVGNGGSYILFTNGLHDGWSVASYLEDLSDTIVTVNIADGAHHSDLGHVFPLSDTKKMARAHEEIKKVLAGWLVDLYGSGSTHSKQNHSSLRS